MASDAAAVMPLQRSRSLSATDRERTGLRTPRECWLDLATDLEFYHFSLDERKFLLEFQNSLPVSC